MVLLIVLRLSTDIPFIFTFQTTGAAKPRGFYLFSDQPETECNHESGNPSTKH